MEAAGEFESLDRCFLVFREDARRVSSRKAAYWIVAYFLFVFLCLGVCLFCVLFFLFVVCLFCFYRRGSIQGSDQR